MSAATLVFGWGNASRGDDALGPLLVERLRALALPGVECLDDYQLQPEHALDLIGRERVLFVDAGLACAAPFEATPLTPQRDASFSSHAMSPAALLQAYIDVHGSAPPLATLLAIRGERFELGEPLSEAAQLNLEAALTWARAFLR
ncbi:MAG: hydrogenase maturation protease [Proteobacteria bacterium]|nr:hydrogenase maturation protease [Pseudomonadota bacterium]